MSVNLRNKVTSRFDRKFHSTYSYHSTNSPQQQMPKLAFADEIQHQIDDQIRMREGAMKLMSACSTLNQALETSKNLLTINARILGLMTALQKKKKQHVLEEWNRQRSSVCSESGADSCTGRIAISDIRVPLMWKDNVHFTGKTGDQAYYAFALIRCGDEVRDTPLYEVTSTDTDMYFGQALQFEELNADFKMDLEVYYTVITSNEAHGIRTPIRTPMHLRTAKKTVQFKAPKFCLAGHAQLTVDDIKKGMISKDLVMGSKGASGVAVLGDIHEFPIHPLELWGQVCCTLAAQPKCMLEDGLSTNCEVKVDDNWKKYFSKIYPSAISCWEEENLMKTTKPAYIMSYTDVKKISQSGNGLEINLISTNETTLHSLKFDDCPLALKWTFAIRSAIVNFQQWKIAVTELMFIEETKKHRLSIPTTASFYEQIQVETVTNGMAKRNGSVLLDNIDEKPDKAGEMTKQQEKVSNDTSVISTPSNQEHLPQQNQINQNHPDQLNQEELTQKAIVTTSEIKENPEETTSLETNDALAALDEVISSELEHDTKTETIEDSNLPRVSCYEEENEDTPAGIGNAKSQIESEAIPTNSDKFSEMETESNVEKEEKNIETPDKNEQNEQNKEGAVDAETNSNIDCHGDEQNKEDIKVDVTLEANDAPADNAQENNRDEPLVDNIQSESIGTNESDVDNNEITTDPTTEVIETQPSDLKDIVEIDANKTVVADSETANIEISSPDVKKEEIATESTIDNSSEPKEADIATVSPSNDSSKPSKEEIATESASDNSSEPKKEEIATVSPSNDSSEPSKEGITTESASDNSSEPKKEDIATVSPSNDSSEPSKEEITTESASDNSSEPKKEEITTVSPSDDSPEPSKEEITTESASDNSSEPKEEDIATVSPSNDSSELSKEEITTESVGESRGKEMVTESASETSSDLRKKEITTESIEVTETEQSNVNDTAVDKVDGMSIKPELNSSTDDSNTDKEKTDLNTDAVPVVAETNTMVEREQFSVNEGDDKFVAKNDKTEVKQTSDENNKKKVLTKQISLSKTQTTV